MTVLDDRLLPKVVALIDKYGMDIAVEIESVRNFDPATGKVLIAGTKRYTTLSDGSALKSTPPTPDTKTFQRLVMTQQAESEIIIPASGLSFTPVKGMKVMFVDDVNEEWRVVAIQRYKSGESVAAWGLALTSTAGENE